ncbi:MAG: 3-deoxy-D-manno-octulosonic acid transferase [Firmicutes bacterium]|nr:3-deoxy-D-manno-octulosonic acid transferase [Bacillota bacterium]
MRVLYSFIILFSNFLIRFSSLFNKKARKWTAGRKNLFPLFEEKCEGKKNIVWFHCASLGEFEQGKPLMEKIKQQDENVTLLLTFFSPSGYEVKKNDPIADIIAYLPADTPKNAKKFIKIIKPKRVFFIKYEFWYNYMNELSLRNIPFYYVSAIFRENQYFFKSYGRWFFNHLKKCTHFFVQNENSETLLRKFGISQVTVTGDTRFDSVYKTAKQPCNLDFIDIFKSDKKLLVAGSTWQQDEKLLCELFTKINPQYKLVIVPHEVNKERIAQIKRRFHAFSTVCYSEKEEKKLSDFDILIVDCMGLLNKIYRYADISYIGGAFKTGLHNILEAAVYKKPLFFGPRYHKFNEAATLVNLGGAFPVSNSKKMAEKIQFFENNSSEYQSICEICKKFVETNLGATERIAFFQGKNR